MEIIKSNKGSDKLCFNGYAYTKKSTNKTTVRWECCKRGSIHCTGALVTNLAVTAIQSVKDHSHPSNTFEIEAMKVKATIKASIHSKHSNPKAIIADNMRHVPVQVRAACGHKESMSRAVRRMKRANLPKEPSSIQDIPFPLPDDFRKTGGADSCEFLIYDNGSESDRILVFGSDKRLKLLSNSDFWFLDGTFDAVPSQFCQLFVIRAAVGESYVSSVYAFLPSKQQKVYEECLTAVLDCCLLKGLRPTPARIIADFELSIQNAVRTVFGDYVDVQGCFYHLTQSTWRKIQSEGLQTVYLSNEDVRHFCGQIDGLAFLPVSDVIDGMTHLRQTAPECLSGVVDYFDTNYVSCGFKSVRAENGSLRFRRIPPRFPPYMWNVHDATLEGQSRTNNVCEGWNHSFKTLVGHSAPSLWYAIDCIQKDNCEVETVYEQHRQGLPPKRRKNKKK